MNYHTSVQSPLQAETLHTSPLTTARLSSLRHDLRTPFNQILGYAEMTAEDAEDTGDDNVKELAHSVAACAHSMLAQLTGAVVGEPELITAEQLVKAQTEIAEPMASLHERITVLENAVQSSQDLPPESAENIAKIRIALRALEMQIDAMARWHQAPEPEIFIRTPRSSSLYSPSAGKLNAARGLILIVDDHLENRDLLRQRLDREGFETAVAADGFEGLKVLEEQSIDLVLLDVLMPGMDGIEVLRRIKTSDALKAIPVIMLSSLDEIERVVQCIEGGAEDYLSKPFNPVLLRARIGVALERKRLRDEEERQRAAMQTMFAELAQERKNAHDLLLNILPEKVANDLQQGHSAPMYFEDCTICFTDFVGFTLSTENMAAELVVEELHTFFTAFDLVMERYGLEKMKTIGDSYMFASGLPKRHPANPVNALLAALELLHETERLGSRPGAPGWELRIGLHTGPVIAGVVGIRKFAFDIWGDSVNFASRMESSGAANTINISERTYARVKDFFLCEHRGKVMTKDKREVDMYFVRGVQPDLIKDGTFIAFAKRYRLYFSEEPPAFPEFLLSSQPAATR